MTQPVLIAETLGGGLAALGEPATGARITAFLAQERKGSALWAGPEPCITGLGFQSDDVIGFCCAAGRVRARWRFEKANLNHMLFNNLADRR